MKKVWIFFPEMTLAQFPKSDFLNFRWIFFPKMTLAQFPVFGFFFQDSRIGVKGSSDPSHFIFEINIGKSRIRHTTTLKLNDKVLGRLQIDCK